jgi:hypothetical protein
MEFYVSCLASEPSGTLHKVCGNFTGVSQLKLGNAHLSKFNFLKEKTPDFKIDPTPISTGMQLLTVSDFPSNEDKLGTPSLTSLMIEHTVHSSLQAFVQKS